MDAFNVGIHNIDPNYEGGLDRVEGKEEAAGSEGGKEEEKAGEEVGKKEEEEEEAAAGEGPAPHLKASVYQERPGEEEEEERAQEARDLAAWFGIPSSFAPAGPGQKGAKERDGGARGLGDGLCQEGISHAAPPSHVIARVVSRGRMTQPASDYGCLEVVGGASIGHTDPYRLIEAIEARLLA